MKITNLSLSENLYDVPRKVLWDIKKECHKINCYPVDIHNKLKQEIAKYHNVEEKNILIGNGLDEMILIAALTLSSIYKRVIVIENTFPGYVESAKVCGLEIIESKIKNSKVSVSDIQGKMKEDVDFIILCNPLNPHGTVISQNECEKIFHLAKKSGVTVIVDEAYGDFANKSGFKSAIEYIDQYENVIVYKSFSKYWGIAGLRCGYALSNENNIIQMSHVHNALPYRVNRIACKAAISCLKHYYLYDAIARKIINNKNMLYKMFDKYGIEYIESETNFVLIKFESNINVDQVCSRLLQEYQICIKNGKVFGMKNCARVGVGTKKQMKYFMDALSSIILSPAKKQGISLKSSYNGGHNEA